MIYFMFIIIAMALTGAVIIYKIFRNSKTNFKNNGKDGKPPDHMYPMW